MGSFEGLSKRHLPSSAAALEARWIRHAERQLNVTFARGFSSHNLHDLWRLRSDQCLVSGVASPEANLLVGGGWSIRRPIDTCACGASGIDHSGSIWQAA